MASSPIVRDQLGVRISRKLKVRLNAKTDPDNGWGEAKNGDIGTVVDIRRVDIAGEKRDMLVIDFPNHGRWNGFGNEVMVINVELCERYNYVTQGGG